MRGASTCHSGSVRSVGYRARAAHIATSRLLPKPSTSQCTHLTAFQTPSITVNHRVIPLALIYCSDKPVNSKAATAAMEVTSVAIVEIPEENTPQTERRVFSPLRLAQHARGRGRPRPPTCARSLWAALAQRLAPPPGVSSRGRWYSGARCQASRYVCACFPTLGMNTSQRELAPGRARLHRPDMRGSPRT
jgi:hypothetical protein